MAGVFERRIAEERTDGGKSHVATPGLEALYGHYEKTYSLWQDASIRVPPCFIVVCNNTSTSKLVYDYISGFHRENEDGSTTLENGRLALFRNYDEHGNQIARPRTLLIDSEQLESGDALDKKFRDMASDEIDRFRHEILVREGAGSRNAENITDQDLLREVMNTVGKEDRLGESIRCVVSVSMLTEGWDANNVTHVLGVRAYPSYFRLLDMPLPEARDGILSRLADDGMIQPNQGGGWDILNLGAVLFASDLANFRHLARKAVRVIEYEGEGRVKTKRERVAPMGYAAGFEGLIAFLTGMLPENEVIGEAFRKTVPMYPELTIRELVANMIIHQDFTVTGTGPMVEVFDGRLEITNPGDPLVDTQRFLDTPPKSRNEDMASFLRRVGICEERGSGVDKVVFQTELYQLPAPLFEVVGGHTRAVLFAHKPFADMDKADRTRACYLHACLQYVQRKQMTNSTLRERFGIERKNSSQVSRVIGDAVEAGVVKSYNPESESRRHASYVPFWA